METRICVTPKYPLFWQAVYPHHLRELKIPICKSCGNLVKVSSYDRVICRSLIEELPSDEEFRAELDRLAEQGTIIPPSFKPLHRQKMARYRECGCEDVSFAPEDGALVVPLQDGILMEFDADGNETINFRLLPTDGLSGFGLIDPLISPISFYMINLRTGNLEFGTLDTGVAMPIGAAIEFETQDGRNIIPISNVLERYGVGGDLIHYKHAVETYTVDEEQQGELMLGRFNMDERVLNISNIVVGYKCEVPGDSGEIEWDAQVKINVDCFTRIPYITTKTNRRV